MDKMLIRAIAMVVQDNRRLCRAIGEVRDDYIYARRPIGCEVALSRALNCESSKAHRYLEDVFAQIKRYGRGCAPRRMVEHWLRDSSLRLLRELRKLCDLLPREHDACAERLRHAIQAAENAEWKTTNFILGESGAGDDMSQEEYRHRMDNAIRDLKRHFNAISGAFDDIEAAIGKSCGRRRKVPSRRRCGRPERDGEEVMKKDRADIRKELLRRMRAKRKKGIATSKVKELSLMYKDEAWSRRCRQWMPGTLLRYMRG